ncbi:hypothetical protein FHG89_30640 [Micromonospora orduensis]|uniref:Uncharacterized protein n=1 Tax=Micromonospora orduensis TaxID=1420891 RepID=A0A5C4QDP9_9ACTN|nr:hypothetical protein [Micromonospora orduensis]TNH21814.1 hypothetical protein FHG89_30640 [Micromonospora orduensis]
MVRDQSRLKMQAGTVRGYGADGVQTDTDGPALVDEANSSTSPANQCKVLTGRLVSIRAPHPFKHAHEPTGSAAGADGMSRADKPHHADSDRPAGRRRRYSTSTPRWRPCKAFVRPAKSHTLAADHPASPESV